MVAIHGFEDIWPGLGTPFLICNATSRCRSCLVIPPHPFLDRTRVTTVGYGQWEVGRRARAEMRGHIRRSHPIPSRLNLFSRCRTYMCPPRLVHCDVALKNEDTRALPMIGDPKSMYTSVQGPEF